VWRYQGIIYGRPKGGCGLKRRERREKDLSLKARGKMAPTGVARALGAQSHSAAAWPGTGFALSRLAASELYLNCMIECE